MPKYPLCVVIPAYNEEKVIISTLVRLKKVIDEQHIYLVSDGSKDRTAELAKDYISNVMELKQNVGKAQALERLISSRDLALHYHYILFSDADSRLSRNFLFEIKKYIKYKPACIVGRVASERHGFISAFRTYEYALSHLVFKHAQDILQTITVAPGCASLYSGAILDQLDFTNHTLTEDFDLTLQIHRKKLGRIIYAPAAKVITQDPPTVRDYWRQICRWYTGFWQNFLLHRLYNPTSKLSLEIYVLMLDGFAVLATLFLTAREPALILKMFVLTYFSLLVFSCLIISLEKKFWALVYVPFFPFLYAINLTAYFYSFFKAFTKRHPKHGWQKITRYSTD